MNTHLNTHLTIDELLAARAGEETPAVRAHLEDCEACRRELDALAQRVAALRALPARRPPRDRWPIVRDGARAVRRRRRVRRAAVGIATAATVVLTALGVRAWQGHAPGADTPPAVRPATQIAQLVQQSQALEAQLKRYNPVGRVVNGRTASTVADLENRIATVDAGITHVGSAPRAPENEVQLVNLWRDRVDLMHALVNVHETNAAYVGF